MNHYSQRDPLWSNIKIGKSNSTIGNFGCFLVSLSMLAYIDPVTANTRLTETSSYSNDLIISSKAAKALKIEYKGKKLIGSIKNPDYVCIAEVDMSPSPGKQQHFVVSLGFNNQIIDPWDGEVKTNPYHVISWRLFEENKPDTKPIDVLLVETKDDIQNYINERFDMLRNELK
jgi:hypothetical protein